MMNKSILIWFATMMMICACASALTHVTDQAEVDDILLNSIENNWYRLYTNAVYPEWFNDTIYYGDFAEPAADAATDAIDRMGAFAIRYDAFNNNFLNGSDVGLVDSFNVTFKANSGGIYHHTCTGFLLTDECIVYYKLTDRDSFGNYNEVIFIYPQVSPPLDRFNITLDVFQFESRAGLTFEEKARNATNANVLTLQDRTMAIMGFFAGIAGISYEAVIILYWVVKIGLILGAMILIITLPFKFVEMFQSIKKRYFRRS